VGTVAAQDVSPAGENGPEGKFVEFDHVKESVVAWQ
jgi:hypothetical protein